MEPSSSMVSSSASFPDRYLACLADRSAPVDEAYGRSFEALATELSETIGVVLRDVHGVDDPFDRFVFPFAAMLIYQMLNAASAGTPPGTPGELPSFDNLAAFVANRQGGAMCAALNAVWKARDPFGTALEMLGGREDADDARGVRDSAIAMEGARPGGRVGISASLTLVEKWFLTLACPGRLRFVKAPPAGEVSRSESARRGVVLKLRALSRRARIETVHERFLAAAGLCLPTYLLEGFAEQRAAAQALSRGLEGLVAALEFQNRPAVALLIPLLRARGGYVVGVQHGGGWYGQTDPGLWERIEWNHSDRYVTWGYRHVPRDLALPAVRLSRPRLREAVETRFHSLAGRDRRSVLVVLANIDSTIGWSVVSPSIHRQADALRRSLTLLQPAHDAGYRLVLRMHPRSTASDYRASLPAFAGEDDLEVGRGPLVVDAARHERVIFTTPNAGGMTECAAAGIEAGIVADPEDFHIREPARPVFRRLIDSGVWLTSRTDVASFFGAQDDDGNERREALAAYARQYAFRSPAYLLHWARFLRRLHQGELREVENR
jgi:hypothetical protein